MSHTIHSCTPLTLHLYVVGRERHVAHFLHKLMSLTVWLSLNVLAIFTYSIFWSMQIEFSNNYCHFIIMLQGMLFDVSSSNGGWLQWSRMMMSTRLFDILFVLISNYHPNFCVPVFLWCNIFFITNQNLCIGARRCLVQYGIVCWLYSVVKPSKTQVHQCCYVCFTIEWARVY